MNHIFKLRENLRVGIMICYEYLNSELRQRMIRACDIILVPQTNPNPDIFYEKAKSDIDIQLCAGNRAYVMANGIYTWGKDEKIYGGYTGIVLTLDKYSNQKKDEIIKPVDGVMEQFVLITSINTNFNPARDTQIGQVPIQTQIIHIFEENEILTEYKKKVEEFLKLRRTIDPSMSHDESEELLGKFRENFEEFIELLRKIDVCKDRDELKKLLEKEKGKTIVKEMEDQGETKPLIKQYSPLMNKFVQNLEERSLDEMKDKCRSILIPIK